MKQHCNIKTPVGFQSANIDGRDRTFLDGGASSCNFDIFFFMCDAFEGSNVGVKKGSLPKWWTIVTSDPRMTLWPVNNGQSEAAGVGQKQGPLLVQ